MARHGIGDENIRKIQVTGREGGSYMITLPKRLVKQLEWQENQKVTVEKKGESLIIKDWKG